MRVLLTNCPNPDFIVKRFYLPLNLLYLSSSLKNHGVSTCIYDHFAKNDKTLEEVIVEFKPDLVGIGCMFSGHIDGVIRISELVKKLSSSPVVIGGIHPTLHYEKILKNCSSVDYIVIGEGEDAICRLCDFLDNKLSLNEIDGLAYRENESIRVNEKTHFLDVTQIPQPDYGSIEINKYYQVDSVNWRNPRNISFDKSCPIITSRSCPMRCNFCSMYLLMGTRIRKRNPVEAVDEIELLYKKYGQQHFSIMDDNLTLDKRHAMGICNEIVRRQLKIQFETPNGVYMQTMDKEVVDALVEAGLTVVSLAIESGSDYIRNKIMGKHLSADKIYEVVELCKQHRDQLFTRAFFIMGMPEDTLETLQESYDMIVKIDVDKPIVTNLLPFAGTKLFEQCVRDNLFVGVNVENLWRYARFYFSGNKEFFVKPYKMTIEELVEFRKKFDEYINHKEKSSRNANQIGI